MSFAAAFALAIFIGSIASLIVFLAFAAAEHRREYIDIALPPVDPIHDDPRPAEAMECVWPRPDC